METDFSSCSTAIDAVLQYMLTWALCLPEPGMYLVFKMLELCCIYSVCFCMSATGL